MRLYLVPKSNQSTTFANNSALSNSCISFPKVINPQRTASVPPSVGCCISFPKVINPQLSYGKGNGFLCCISFPKVINPQLCFHSLLYSPSCISFPKVINPQRRRYIVVNINGLEVVGRLIKSRCLMKRANRGSIFQFKAT